MCVCEKTYAARLMNAIMYQGLLQDGREKNSLFVSSCTCVHIFRGVNGIKYMKFNIFIFGQKRRYKSPFYSLLSR